MKNKLFLVGFVGIMLAIGFLVIGCSNDTTNGPKTVTIKYQITGTTAMCDSISYTNSTGGYDSLDNVTLPWEKSFSVTIEGGKYFGASISGHAPYGTSCSLTAKIFVNGTEVESKTSSSDTYTSVSAIEIVRN